MQKEGRTASSAVHDISCTSAAHGSRNSLGSLAGSEYALQGDISRFSPRIDRIFPWEALNPFFVLKMKDFWNFVPDNCILNFDTEQVYLMLQVTNLKNNKVTVNPKPQTLRKI